MSKSNPDRNTWIRNCHIFRISDGSIGYNYAVCNLEVEPKDVPTHNSYLRINTKKEDNILVNPLKSKAL